LAADNYVLEMNNITKRYGMNTVLENVSLKIKPGEIHALLGENGAGKSTLMNVLFGMPVIHTTGGFEGELLVDGAHADIKSPMDAMNAGIGMVHQEFMLIPGFTITENIKLNREKTKSWFMGKVSRDLEFLDEGSMNIDAKDALQAVGMKLYEGDKVKGLPIGHQQFIEIAREIDKKGIKLLVFDEPTAVLTESEAEQLLSVMKEISARGIAIIFITHRLAEVMEVADSVTILRDGKLVTSLATQSTTMAELAGLMIGRGDESLIKIDKGGAAEKSGNVAMRIRNLHVDMPGETVNGVDADIMEGEIFGIGGLAGQGKIGIPNGVMGLYPAYGSVELFGKKLPLNNAKAALKAGLAMVSEDRKGVGLLLDQSIEDNIVFNAMQINGDFLLSPLPLKNKSAIRKYADQMIKDLDIRCTSALQAAGTLSGGNQQKVCVARALALKPKFIFVSEPTRGIDIGAKQLVLETLVRLNREQGMTVVVVSSELQELRSICDRIAVVSEGKIACVLRPDSSDVSYGLTMSGEKVEEGELA